MVKRNSKVSKGIGFKKIVFLTLILTSLFVIGIIYFQKNKPQYNNCLVDGSIELKDLDIIFGCDSASMNIYMFSSYNCAFCRKFFLDVFPTIEKNYIDKGLLKFTVKLVDLSNDPNMNHALKTCVCINEYGNFTSLNTLLLNEPSVIYNNQFVLITEDFIDKDHLIAECMLGGEAENYLMENVALFNRLSLTGTPTFIINNKIYKGFRPYAFFEDIIENELLKYNY